MRRALLILTLLLAASGTTGQGAPAGQQNREPAELMAAAKIVGEVPAWENEYVRVTYDVLEYPPAAPSVAASRPLVLYLRVSREGRGGETRLLEAVKDGRSPWRPGVVPRGVRVDVIAPPPEPPRLGLAGTDPPRGSLEEEHRGFRLVLAAFPSLDFSVGTGPLPSVTVFLSDGVVDVSSRGTRRRMGVRAGDAFWFDAATRLTVVSDDPVAAAIVQLAR